jgi:glycosyltransferase involved in cell wall biosynthesis
MPNAFLEAAAHECAILAGLDPDGFASEFGYHVKPGGGSKYPTADDFAAGLRWLLEGDRWRALGQRGREHVASTFETEVAMRLHIEMYQDHLARRTAGVGR